MAGHEKPTMNDSPRRWRRTACLLGLGTLGLVAPIPAQFPPTPPSPPVTCGDSLPEIYDRISSAVVSVGAMSINPFDIDNRLDRVTGSGLIIDTTGLILTNSHVVFGRQVITVTLDNGTTVPASLVGADPVFDVALLKIPPPDSGQLPVAPLGDSDHLRIGAEVYAIGNPLGLDQTLTRGIVSGINRLLPGTGWSLTEPLIQTDAAINPGSSGGPLVDRCGLVVGITTAIIPEAQGIGFAVPIRLARKVLPQLILRGHVTRPWLGVQGQFVSPVLKELLRIPLADGLLVEAVEPGSPAARDGLRGGSFELTLDGHSVLLGGDVITEVNGVRIDSPASLEPALDSLRIGSTAHITIVRAGQERTENIAIVERPSFPAGPDERRLAEPTALPAGPVARQRIEF